MSTFLSLVKNGKCEEIHRVVKVDGEQFLCYTKCSSSWAVFVTDGVSLWKVDIDEDAAIELAGTSSLDAFFTRFRNGFQSGDLNVSVVGKKLTLYIGKGATPLTIDLYETNAALKKSEMQSVLFRLAETSTKLASDLDKAHQLVDSLKAQKGSGPSAAFMDLGPKKGQNVAKNKPSKVGMSVINPSSKKRKAAKGVVFD